MRCVATSSDCSVRRSSDCLRGSAIGHLFFERRDPKIKVKYSSNLVHLTGPFRALHAERIGAVVLLLGTIFNVELVPADASAEKH